MMTTDDATNDAAMTRDDDQQPPTRRGFRRQLRALEASVDRLATLVRSLSPGAAPPAGVPLGVDGGRCPVASWAPVQSSPGRSSTARPTSVRSRSGTNGTPRIPMRRPQTSLRPTRRSWPASPSSPRTKSATLRFAIGPMELDLPTLRRDAPQRTCGAHLGRRRDLRRRRDHPARRGRAHRRHPGHDGRLRRQADRRPSGRSPSTRWRRNAPSRSRCGRTAWRSRRSPPSPCPISNCPATRSSGSSMAGSTRPTPPSSTRGATELDELRKAFPGF